MTTTVNTINGNEGNNRLTGTSRNDVINGNGGNDRLNGGSGADTLNGGAGKDELNGGSGNDVLDGGSGSDELEGGSGNDTLIYTLAENNVIGRMTYDEYEGGSGADTLELRFTRAEWMNTSYQAVLQNYLNWANKSGSGCRWDDDFTFRFGNARLEIEDIEKLVVKVDGDEIINAGKKNNVDAVNDAPDSITEDETGVQSIYVLRNDSVDNLVKSLELLPTTTNGTVELIKPDVGNANTWYFNYTPNSTHYQYLNASQSATETFTYRVTDADGDQDTATVTITITGVDDDRGRSANVTELINLNYQNPIIAEKATLGGDYDYLHVRTGQFLLSDAPDSITQKSTTDGGTGYLGSFEAFISDQKNSDGKYLVTWTYKVNDSLLDPLNATIDGTPSKDQIYTLTFGTETDEISTNVVLHLFGQDEVVSSSNNADIFIDNIDNTFGYYDDGTLNASVFYLDNLDDNVTKINGAYVIYGEDGDDYIFPDGGESLVFGGKGLDNITIFFATNTGMYFGGDERDVLFIVRDSLNINSPKDSTEYYLWGGDGSDLFTQEIYSPIKNKDWIMDFNFSPTSEGGDEINLKVRENGEANSYTWDINKTKLSKYQADSSHQFLSDGADYYELAVKLPNDENWHTVFNLVGTDITLEGLFANTNLVA